MYSNSKKNDTSNSKSDCRRNQKHHNFTTIATERDQAKQKKHRRD